MPDPADRRARIVRRIDRGHEVVDAVLTLQGRFEERWAGQVGAERWAAAREVLAELFGTDTAASPRRVRWRRLPTTADRPTVCDGV